MGYKIKECREALNMTQECLCEKAGISRGTLCALESGKSKTTTTKTLLKIAKALNKTVDEIFFDCSV